MIRIILPLDIQEILVLLIILCLAAFLFVALLLCLFSIRSRLIFLLVCGLPLLLGRVDADLPAAPLFLLRIVIARYEVVLGNCNTIGSDFGLLLSALRLLLRRVLNDLDSHEVGVRLQKYKGKHAEELDQSAHSQIRVLPLRAQADRDEFSEHLPGYVAQIGRALPHSHHKAPFIRSRPVGEHRNAPGEPRRLCEAIKYVAQCENVEAGKAQ